MNCIKIFRRINGELCSLYNVYPLVYKENEWTEAPEGTKLFCYELGEYLNEYYESSLIEAWYCECDEIFYIRGGFVDVDAGTFFSRESLIFNKHLKIIRNSWKEYKNITEKDIDDICCINKVKPLYKVEAESFKGKWVSVPRD